MVSNFLFFCYDEIYIILDFGYKFVKDDTNRKWFHSGSGGLQQTHKTLNLMTPIISSNNSHTNLVNKLNKNLKLSINDIIFLSFLFITNSINLFNYFKINSRVLLLLKFQLNHNQQTQRYIINYFSMIKIRQVVLKLNLVKLLILPKLILLRINYIWKVKG